MAARLRPCVSETRRSDHLGLAAVADICGARGGRARAALAAGGPELAVLATPFLLLVAVGLAGSGAGSRRGLRLERERALEGEHVGATVTVRASGAPARVEVHLPTSARLHTDPIPIAFWLPNGERREVRFELAARRWGVHARDPR